MIWSTIWQACNMIYDRHFPDGYRPMRWRQIARERSAQHVHSLFNRPQRYTSSVPVTRMRPNGLRMMLRDQSGQDLLEYALLAAVIALGCLVFLGDMSKQLQNEITNTSTAIQATHPDCSTTQPNGEPWPGCGG
jgi:Flp pilus assembly pilin Flp